MVDIKYILEFMSRYDFCDEAVEAVIKTAETVITKEENIKELQRAEEILLSDSGTACDETIEIVGKVAEEANVNKHTLYLVFYLSASKHLLKMYKERNLDEKIIYDTLEDFLFKANECKLLTGVYGLYTPRWIFNYFHKELYTLGRLQFVIGPFNFEEYEIAGRKMVQGDKVIHVHIPRNDKPFTKEARMDSYKKAYAFFKDQFKDELIPFTCCSWLLCDVNEKILKPTSNIVSFCHDFTRLINSYDDVPDWRIFGREYTGNIDDMPETSSLMRGYKKWIKDGNKAGSALGLFLYDGISNDTIT